MKKEEHS